MVGRGITFMLALCKFFYLVDSVHFGLLEVEVSVKRAVDPTIEHFTLTTFVLKLVHHFEPKYFVHW